MSFFTSLSQCKSGKIQIDSCKKEMVLLTVDDFTELYVAKRTLTEISKEFPELKKKLKQAEKSLKKEKDLHQLKIETTQKTLEEVKRLVTKIELDKIKLENKLEDKTKRNKDLLGLNLIQGVILVITFTLIIAK
jgi:hypothetical protein